VESIKVSGGASSPYTTMILLLFVEAILLMAAAWLIAKRSVPSEEENFLYINCEKCRQKIRYHEQQVGMAAMCRRCKHAFVYPDADDE